LSSNNVVIIGAGPAGIATALTLQRFGCKCTVVEEKSFPRNKACGGLLTSKSMSLLRILLDDDDRLNENSKALYKVYVSFKKKDLFSYECNTPFFSASRWFLDNELVTQFKEKQGVIFENCKCSYIDQEESSILTTQGKLKYDVLVVANGADQKIRGLESSQIITGMGGIGTVRTNKYRTDGISISVGYLNQGYSWIFPQRDDSFNVGFAGNIHRTKSFSAFFSEIMDEYGLKQNDICWGRVPISQVPVKETPHNVFTIGSSNRMVDSLTGEGIFFALLSGIYTGLVLADRISHAKYQQLIRHIKFLVRGGDFSAGILWKLNLLPVTLKLGAHLKKLDAHMTDNLISNYNYNHYSALFAPVVTYLNVRTPSEKIINELSRWV